MNTNLVEAGKATRFVKGQSGNPNGRRKEKPLTDALLRELLVRPYPQSPVCNLELVVSDIVQRAQAGDAAAWRIIFERIEGLPVQPHEVSGPDGGAIKFTIRLGAARGDSDSPADS